MATQLLNLPVNIPWKLIAVSQDMMDTQFCDKVFPFEWQSSSAISVFEPKKEDLQENLCDDMITYIKVTCTITGYVRTKPETEKAYRDFSYGAPTDEFQRKVSEGLDNIFSKYLACYGVLVNVAVFPYPHTVPERTSI